MMSAPVDPFFYEKLGVNFTDSNVTNIQQQGQVIHSKGSMWSKRRLKTLIQKNEFDKLPKTENDVVLTYQEFKSLFEKAHPTIHFGHCEGFNEFESENLSIVGTPIPHPFMVFFYAHAFNLESITQEKRMRKVEFDGFPFRMYTYVDENLAPIEIRFARMQIDQLVGRARTLRNDCVVSVSSGIPPSDTTIQRKDSFWIRFESLFWLWLLDRFHGKEADGWTDWAIPSILKIRLQAARWSNVSIGWESATLDFRIPNHYHGEFDPGSG